MSAAAIFRWAVVIVSLAVSVFAFWVVAPRFEVDGPSLVDDWAAIARSPEQVSDLLRLSNPEEERFRPGWILWNYLQWHTFDAPRGLVGPNAWNVARVLVLVLGLTLLTALLLSRPRRPRDALVAAVLAGLPAFLVFTVPKLARDVAWFGPQEPLLIGASALGGALLALAARSLLSLEPLSRTRTTAFAVGGTAFWLLGMYHKEASVSAVPLVAAALISGWGLRTRWSALGPRRRAALGVLAGAVALPLVHVAVQVARIAARGDIVYGAEVDGGAGIVRGLEVLWDWSHEALPLNSRYVMAAAVLLTVVATIVRRRLELLALGALASGALTIVFAAQSGVAVSRYYMPAYALFAVALAVSLSRLPAVVQAAGAMLVIFAFVPTHEPRDEVRRWVEEENQGVALVRNVAELEASGCVVATEGLDLETSVAIPVLVGLEDASRGRTCVPGSVYLVLPPFAEGVPLAGVCAELLQPLVVGRLANLYQCGRLSSRSLRHPELGVVRPDELVRLRLLRPAT